MRKEKEKKKALNLETEIIKRRELPEKYIVKILFGQNNEKFENEYLKKLKKSWIKWNGKERQVLSEVLS